MIIQIGEGRVAYDGREWAPVSGERDALLVTILRSQEGLFKRLVTADHPDFAYHMAQAAAADFGGEIVKYQPEPDVPN
ncbi:MAG TPA: hypothetical protein VIC84_24525 [Blastocatellia bacterium]